MTALPQTPELDGLYYLISEFDPKRNWGSKKAPHGGGARGLFAFVARLRLSGRLITAGFMVTQCGFRWANLKYGAFLTAHGDSNGA
jgi:hypothetical protein